MQTKYGYIAIAEESGIKKLDAANSKFKSMLHFRNFLNDTKLLKEIFGY